MHPKTSTSQFDPFGRYYTNEWASEVLVEALPDMTPRTIIDLGAGAGALSKAAHLKWRNAQIITVDIDTDAQARHHFEKNAIDGIEHLHFSYDVLSADLPKTLGKHGRNADLAICNPPFVRPPWRAEFAEILEDAGLSGCYSTMKDVPAEVLFLAQNLRLLKDRGVMGIIVPDGIISAKRNQSLRKKLLHDHVLSSVIKLPRTAFVGTDAQAFILTLTKGSNAFPNNIELKKLSSDASVSRITVPMRTAERSLDFDLAALKLPQKNTAPLGNLIISLTRGIATSKDRSSSSLYFHTTDFPVGSNRIDLRSKQPIHLAHTCAGRIAEPGDILIARVGRNLEKKVCIVTNGSAEVTDCVYIIKPKAKYRAIILADFISAAGRAWLSAASHGVSASQIPKVDLLGCPVKYK